MDYDNKPKRLKYTLNRLAFKTGTKSVKVAFPPQDEKSKSEFSTLVFQSSVSELTDYLNQYLRDVDLDKIDGYFIPANIEVSTLFGELLDINLLLMIETKTRRYAVFSADEFKLKDSSRYEDDTFDKNVSHIEIPIASYRD